MSGPLGKPSHLSPILVRLPYHEDSDAGIHVRSVIVDSDVASDHDRLELNRTVHGPSWVTDTYRAGNQFVTHFPVLEVRLQASESQDFVAVFRTSGPFFFHRLST